MTAGRSVVARLLAKLAQRKGLSATLLVRDGAGYAVLEGDTGLTIAGRKSVDEVLQGIVDKGRFHAILDPVGGPSAA